MESCHLIKRESKFENLKIYHLKDGINAKLVPPLGTIFIASFEAQPGANINRETMESVINHSVKNHGYTAQKLEELFPENTAEQIRKQKHLAFVFS